jgi:hypothetical protein
MIQQTILFKDFISSLPQKEAMKAEPWREGKRTCEKEPDAIDQAETIRVYPTVSNDGQLVGA